MSTVYVDGNGETRCESVPDRTSSRWRDVRFFRLSAKALRWAVARLASYWSPERRISVDGAVYFISRTDDYISCELVRGGGYHTKRLERAIACAAGARRRTLSGAGNCSDAANLRGTAR